MTAPSVWRRGFVVVMAGIGGVLPPLCRLPAQDSVVIIRGGEAVARNPAPAIPPASDPERLPDFLTPAECSRLLRYRDGDLARSANLALAREEVDADAATDMTALREELQRDYTTGQLLALRNSFVFVARETVDRVRDAFRLAEFLTRGDGTPKPLSDLIADLAREGGKAGSDAVVEGKVERYRQRLNEAATNLNSALQRLLAQSETVQRAGSLQAAQQELDEMRRTTLPALDTRISEYRRSVREANRELASINDELQLIDAALRKACR